MLKKIRDNIKYKMPQYKIWNDKLFPTSNYLDYNLLIRDSDHFIKTHFIWFVTPLIFTTTHCDILYNGRKNILLQKTLPFECIKWIFNKSKSGLAYQSFHFTFLNCTVHLLLPVWLSSLKPVSWGRLLHLLHKK